jgi:hypothetical protein
VGAVVLPAADGPAAAAGVLSIGLRTSVGSFLASLTPLLAPAGTSGAELQPEAESGRDRAAQALLSTADLLFLAAFNRSGTSHPAPVGSAVLLFLSERLDPRTRNVSALAEAVEALRRRGIAPFVIAPTAVQAAALAAASGDALPPLFVPPLASSMVLDAPGNAAVLPPDAVDALADSLCAVRPAMPSNGSVPVNACSLTNERAVFVGANQPLSVSAAFPFTAAGVPNNATFCASSSAAADKVRCVEMANATVIQIANGTAASRMQFSVFPPFVGMNMTSMDSVTVALTPKPGAFECSTNVTLMSEPCSLGVVTWLDLAELPATYAAVAPGVTVETYIPPEGATLTWLGDRAQALCIGCPEGTHLILSPGLCARAIPPIPSASPTPSPSVTSTISRSAMRTMSLTPSASIFPTDAAGAATFVVFDLVVEGVGLEDIVGSSIRAVRLRKGLQCLMLGSDVALVDVKVTKFSSSLGAGAPVRTYTPAFQASGINVLVPDPGTVVSHCGYINEDVANVAQMLDAENQAFLDSPAPSPARAKLMRRLQAGGAPKSVTVVSLHVRTTRTVAPTLHASILEIFRSHTSRTQTEAVASLIGTDNTAYYSSTVLLRALFPFLWSSDGRWALVSVPTDPGVVASSLPAANLARAASGPNKGGVIAGSIIGALALLALLVLAALVLMRRRKEGKRQRKNRELGMRQGSNRSLNSNPMMTDGRIYVNPKGQASTGSSRSLTSDASDKSSRLYVNQKHGSGPDGFPPTDAPDMGRRMYVQPLPGSTSGSSRSLATSRDGGGGDRRYVQPLSGGTSSQRSLLGRGGSNSVNGDRIYISPAAPILDPLVFTGVSGGVDPTTGRIYIDAKKSDGRALKLKRGPQGNLTVRREQRIYVNARGREHVFDQFIGARSSGDLTKGRLYVKAHEGHSDVPLTDEQLDEGGFVGPDGVWYSPSDAQRSGLIDTSGRIFVTGRLRDLEGNFFTHGDAGRKVVYDPTTGRLYVYSSDGDVEVDGDEIAPAGCIPAGIWGDDEDSKLGDTCPGHRIYVAPGGRVPGVGGRFYSDNDARKSKKYDPTTGRLYVSPNQRDSVSGNVQDLDSSSISDGDYDFWLDDADIACPTGSGGGRIYVRGRMEHGRFFMQADAQQKGITVDPKDGRIYVKPLQTPQVANAAPTEAYLSKDGQFFSHSDAFIQGLVDRDGRIYVQPRARGGDDDQSDAHWFSRDDVTRDGSSIDPTNGRRYIQPLRRAPSASRPAIQRGLRRLLAIHRKTMTAEEADEWMYRAERDLAHLPVEQLEEGTMHWLTQNDALASAGNHDALDGRIYVNPRGQFSPQRAQDESRLIMRMNPDAPLSTYSKRATLKRGLSYTKVGAGGGFGEDEDDEDEYGHEGEDMSTVYMYTQKPLNAGRHGVDPSAGGPGASRSTGAEFGAGQGGLTLRQTPYKSVQDPQGRVMFKAKTASMLVRTDSGKFTSSNPLARKKSKGILDSLTRRGKNINEDVNQFRLAQRKQHSPQGEVDNVRRSGIMGLQFSDEPTVDGRPLVLANPLTDSTVQMPNAQRPRLQRMSSDISKYVMNTDLAAGSRMSLQSDSRFANANPIPVAANHF